jgi:hypothetical protein
MSDWVVTKAIPPKEESEWMMTSSMPEEKPIEEAAPAAEIPNSAPAQLRESPEWLNFLRGVLVNSPLGMVDSIANGLAFMHKAPAFQDEEVQKAWDESSKNLRERENITPKARKAVDKLLGVKHQEVPGLSEEIGTMFGYSPLEKVKPAAKTGPLLVKGYKTLKELLQKGAKRLAESTGAATAVKYTPEIADEDNPLGKTAENIAKAMAGSLAGGRAYKGLAHNTQSAAHALAPGTFEAPKELSKHQQKAVMAVKNQMSPQEIKEVIENTKNLPDYTALNYEPTTAELAKSPTLAALHRVRYGIPESGLARKVSAQNKGIQEAFEPHEMNPATSSQMTTALENELEHRVDTRRKAVKEPYEKVDLNENELKPSHYQSYLDKKSKSEAGSILKDITELQNEVKPPQLSKADQLYLKDYLALGQKYQVSAPKPKGGNPEVRKLGGIYRSLNDKIEKAKRAEEKARAMNLEGAQEALKKDLEVIPEHVEAVSNYKKHSQAVDAILEHKKLKYILENGHRTNKLMREVFVRKYSADNVRALKETIGKDAKMWEGVRSAAAEHFHRSISGKQAGVKGNVITYAKLNNFLYEYGDALKEIFTPEQMKFVEQLEHAMNGRNIAQTLAEVAGSPTAARQAMDEIMKQGIGLRAADAATKFAPTSKYLKALKYPFEFMLNRWISKNQQNALAVLDEILVNPKTAHELFKHEFKTQIDFNDYLNQLARAAKPIQTEKEKDHE